MKHPPKTESDSEKYTSHPERVETEDELSSDDVGLNCIRPTPSIHLSVVKCVPSQPAKKDDWRKLQPFTHSPRLETRVIR